MRSLKYNIPFLKMASFVFSGVKAAGGGGHLHRYNLASVFRLNSARIILTPKKKHSVPN